MPLSSCSPVAWKMSPLPATMSLTVWETSTCRRRRRGAKIRAPVVTAMPSAASLVDHLALAGVDAGPDLDPRGRAPVSANLESAVDGAGGTVEGGVEAVAGGVVLDASPAWSASRTSRVMPLHGAPSQVAAACLCSVEPTMSVNSTVERIVSSADARGSTPTKRWIASSRGRSHRSISSRPRGHPLVRENLDSAHSASATRRTRVISMSACPPPTIRREWAPARGKTARCRPPTRSRSELDARRLGYTCFGFLSPSIAPPPRGG